MLYWLIVAVMVMALCCGGDRYRWAQSPFPCTMI